MIIHGTKPVLLKTSQPQNLKCPTCETEGSTVFSIYSKHKHIFWIPLFPFGKVGVSECLHCKNMLDDNEMTGEMKHEYDQLKLQVKAPIWQFSGLALIVVLVTLGIISSENNKKENLEFITNPVAGDVYEYEENGNFSTFKVVDVINDSVYVVENLYEINKKRKVHTIDKDENYDSLSFGFSRAQVIEFYNSGEFYEVNRN